MRRFFDDDIRGTALDHLSKGLVEAHARDEAGHGDDAGHDRMWYAVRDIAFENPVTQDETELMLRRMGLSFGAGPDPDGETARESCRESVCPYVSTTAAVQSFKQK